MSLHYTSHTKAYNTIYTACNIVEAIYSFAFTLFKVITGTVRTSCWPNGASTVRSSHVLHWLLIARNCW